MTAKADANGRLLLPRLVAPLGVQELGTWAVAA